ncbi:MAG: FAD-dependent oxidoreductase, partial [Desulfovermiculus sp.]
MAEKIGVYFDKANIGPLLDCEALAEKVKNKWGNAVPVVKVEPILASEAGHKTIKSDIDAGEIDAVCVCGSSPRVDFEFFDFGPSILVDRVNLREQVVWAYENPDGSKPQAGGDTPELLMEMAADYVNMGVIKLQKTEIPEPETLETTKTILVLGGGWTGLNAALSSAQAGYDVILVEKEKELGGYAAKMYKTFPLSSPFTKAQDTGIESRIEAVQNHEKIRVYTETTLEELSGQPGQYTASLKSGKKEVQEQVGSMVVATGWEPQDTKYLKPLGYGASPNVVT